MTKRNLCLIPVLTLLFFAVGTTSVWALDLKIGDVTVSPGETFDVQVSFSETISVRGGEFDIAYDDSVLTFNIGTASSSHGFSNVGLVDGVSGVVKVMVAGVSAASVDVVATLNFTLAEDADGTTPLTFADTSAGFYDGTNYDDPISFTPVDGTVSAMLKGDVNGDGVISVDDIINVINFIFKDIEATDGEFASADMNDDDKINVKDVLIMINIIFGG